MNCNWKTNAKVSIVKSTDTLYPTIPPFHPPERFPELSFLPEFECDPANAVYPAVRDLLARISGTHPSPQWNPLADIVHPGDTVVLKPNFIKEHHETRLDEWEQVITHGSTREEAIIRMERALDELVIEGIGTTTPFHQALLKDKSFREGEFHTGFLNSFKFSKA